MELMCLSSPACSKLFCWSLQPYVLLCLQCAAGCCSILVVLVGRGRLCWDPSVHRAWSYRKGFALCKKGVAASSSLLLAGGGLILQNNPGWVQGFSSLDAVGGDGTGKLNLKRKIFSSGSRTSFSTLDLLTRGFMCFSSEPPRKEGS